MSPKRTLVLLLLMFGLPILLGNLFYKFNPGFFSSSTVNYGTLLKPITPITNEYFLDSGELGNRLQGKWTLLYYAKECDRNCEEVLHKIKTIHLLTNDKMRRVQRVLLSESFNNDTQDKELMVGRASNQFFEVIKGLPEMSIFLLDPNGNMILYYPSQELDSKAVLKDLGRLFKYSRIG